MPASASSSTFRAGPEPGRGPRPRGPSGVYLGGQEPLLLAPEELAGHFPGGQLPAELAQRAFALGLIALDDAKVVVRSPRSLEIGSELSAMGIPLGELIDELELLQTETAVIAQRFTSLFERYLWAEFVVARPSRR